MPRGRRLLVRAVKAPVSGKYRTQIKRRGKQKRRGEGEMAEAAPFSRSALYAGLKSRLLVLRNAAFVLVPGLGSASKEGRAAWSAMLTCCETQRCVHSSLAGSL